MLSQGSPLRPMGRKETVIAEDLAEPHGGVLDPALRVKNQALCRAARMAIGRLSALKTAS